MAKESRSTEPEPGLHQHPHHRLDRDRPRPETTPLPLPLPTSSGTTSHGNERWPEAAFLSMTGRIDPDRTCCFDVAFCRCSFTLTVHCRAATATAIRSQAPVDRAHASSTTRAGTECERQATTDQTPAPPLESASFSRPHFFQLWSAFAIPEIPQARLFGR